jgi:hypothetical protein
MTAAMSRNAREGRYLGCHLGAHRRERGHAGNPDAYLVFLTRCEREPTVPLPRRVLRGVAYSSKADLAAMHRMVLDKISAMDKTNERIET